MKLVSFKYTLCLHIYSILLADEVSKQVCALKVLAISIGKGQDNLAYIYEEYNSVSYSVTCALPCQVQAAWWRDTTLR